MAVVEQQTCFGGEVCVSVSKGQLLQLVLVTEFPL